MNAVPRLAGALLRHELRLLRAILLAAARRDDGVRPGDVAVRPVSDLGTGMLLVALTAVEVVAVELLPLPGPVTVVLRLVGMWGLVVLVGLLAAAVTRPHVVRPEGLLVRQGGILELDLPWHVVERIERRTRRDASSWEVAGGHLRLPVQGETTVDVLLREPVTVRLPLSRATHEVSLLSISVREPDVLLAARPRSTA